MDKVSFFGAAENSSLTFFPEKVGALVLSASCMFQKWEGASNEKSQSEVTKEYVGVWRKQGS